MVLWLCRGAWNELAYIGNSPHIPLGESSVRSRTFTLFYFIFSRRFFLVIWLPEIFSMDSA